jgi:hypothetical protein
MNLYYLKLPNLKLPDLKLQKFKLPNWKLASRKIYKFEIYNLEIISNKWYGFKNTFVIKFKISKLKITLLDQTSQHTKKIGLMTI